MKSEPGGVKKKKMPIINDNLIKVVKENVDLYGHVGQDVESRDYAYTIYSPLHHIISSVVFLFLTLRM